MTKTQDKKKEEVNKCPKCKKKLSPPFWNGAYCGEGVYHFECRPDKANKKLTELQKVSVLGKNQVDIIKNMKELNQ